MNDSIVPGNQSIKQVRIANVANNELNSVLRKPGNTVRISGIGQLIQDGDTHIRNVVHNIADKRRTAKTTAARNQDIAVFSLHVRYPSSSH